MERSQDSQVETSQTTDSHRGRETPHESETERRDGRTDHGDETSSLDLVTEPEEKDIYDSMVRVDHTEEKRVGGTESKTLDQDGQEAVTISIHGGAQRTL